MELKDINDIKDILDPGTDGIAPVEIDPDTINDEAEQYCLLMVEDLSKYYYNETFMDEHPNVKKHIQTDMDSLRILFKMRASDEIIHNVLLKAIGQNPGNASLYRSLTDIQRSLLGIQNKIDEIIKALNVYLKGYQLELNFDQTKSEDDDNVKSTTKGSKSFIEQMRSKVV